MRSTRSLSGWTPSIASRKSTCSLRSGASSVRSRRCVSLARVNPSLRATSARSRTAPGVDGLLDLMGEREHHGDTGWSANGRGRRFGDEALPMSALRAMQESGDDLRGRGHGVASCCKGHRCALARVTMLIPAYGKNKTAHGAMFRCRRFTCTCPLVAVRRTCRRACRRRIRVSMCARH